MKNVFFSFEGIDGSGKDTLIEYCVHLIKSDPEIFGDKYSNIWVTREPTKITKAGKELAKKLKEGFNSGLEAALLFVEDRIQHSKIIKEMLNHSHVLCSRYDLSTLAYQKTQGVGFEELCKMHKYGQEEGTLLPDLTIYIKVDPEIAIKRVYKRKEDKEVFEKLDFQTKLVENYDFVINELQKRGRKILVLDGNQSLERVKNEFRSKLMNYQNEL